MAAREHILQAALLRQGIQNQIPRQRRRIRINIRSDIDNFSEMEFLERSIYFQLESTSTLINQSNILLKHIKIGTYFSIFYNALLFL